MPKTFIKMEGKYWKQAHTNNHAGYDMCKCGSFKVNVSKMCRLCEYKLRKGNSNIGTANSQWKGERVSEGALHDYVKYHLPKPSCCSICGKETQLDLANISQQYKRELTDWEWICRKCHMKKDGRLDRLLEIDRNRKRYMKTR